MSEPQHRYHLSRSPSTMSMLPSVTMRSGIFAPRVMSASGWRFASVGARHRAAAAERERLLLRELAHVDEAQANDVVVEEEVLVLDDPLAHVAHVARALVEPVRGQVVLHAADAEPVVREPGSGQAFE